MSDNQHTYPPGNPPLDPQFTDYIENLLRSQLAAAEQSLQQQLEHERAGWMKQQMESQIREQNLHAQVEQLQDHLKKTQLETTDMSMASVQPVSPQPSTPARRSTRNTNNLLHPAQSSSPKTAHPPKQLRSQKTKSTTTPLQPTPPNPSPAKTTGTHKTAAQVHRLLRDEIPEEARAFKKAFELHIRILWGVPDATAVPPIPDAAHVSYFHAHFSDSATQADLEAAVSGPQRIDVSLVQIGSSISITTSKRLLVEVKAVEEFILEYVQTFLAKFGLVRFCPDYNQSAYSTYNSACRLIALETFKQALLSQAYVRLRPNRKFAQDMTFMIKLYDHFVFHHMFKKFKRESLQPGITRAMSEANPSYQNRKRLAEVRRDFLGRNGYPQRYIDLIDTKATSDDEADENGKRENGKLVYWIRRRPERSARMEEFIRLLDKKREEELRYGGSRGSRERLRRMPEVQTETPFPVVPFGIPIDYFDPAFFNARGPALRKKMALHVIALLPNIGESFAGVPDECLSDVDFNEKYGDDVLALYKLDDLDGIEEAEEGGEWTEDESMGE